MNDSVVVHAVSASGVYLGLVPIAEAFKEVLGPPPDQSWHWDFDSNSWARSASVDELKSMAKQAIDLAAGAARAKYITTSSGQEGTYMLKSAQAEEFKAANYTGSVPGLVQAEMTALSISAEQATAQILRERDLWVGLASAVETIRRVGKVGITNATTDSQILQIRTSTINQLEAI